MCKVGNAIEKEKKKTWEQQQSTTRTAKAPSYVFKFLEKSVFAIFSQLTIRRIFWKLVNACNDPKRFHIKPRERANQKRRKLYIARKVLYALPTYSIHSIKWILSYFKGPIIFTMLYNNNNGKVFWKSPFASSHLQCRNSIRELYSGLARLLRTHQEEASSYIFKIV